jgi:hypothetical protein
MKALDGLSEPPREPNHRRGPDRVAGGIRDVEIGHTSRPPARTCSMTE